MREIYQGQVKSLTKPKFVYNCLYKDLLKFLSSSTHWILTHHVIYTLLFG